MAPLSAVSFSLLFTIFCAVTFRSTVLGDCSFPATYTNKFWFRMYSDSNLQKYIYRIFTSNIDDMQNDNATLFKNHYPCSSIVTDSTDSNTVYYLYDNYGIQTCAKSVITSDSSSILLQEVAVNSTVNDASQCISFIVPSGSVWMSVVSSLSQPPPFAASSLCPFPGLFQMTASLSSSPSTVECSGDVQSTAIFYGSNAQLNLCGQGTLRNTTFKSKTILAQDPLICMASVDGRALNANEAGSTIVLLRDSNAIYCARYRNVSVGLELTINVKNDANYAGCFFTPTSTNPVLQLILIPVTSTPGLSTTTTPLSTASLSVPTTTSTAVSPASSTTSSTTSTSSTVTGSSTTGSTGTGSTITSSTVSGSTTTFSTTSPASVPTSSTSLPTSSTSLPTTPYTTTSATTSTTPATTQSTTTTTTNTATSLVTPGPTSSTSPGASTTTRGTSKGPPVDIAWPSDNCPATPCGAPATCNEATHNCSCQTVFYTYSSNSSRCIQDDRSIDDTFLKIVVPVIATAIIGTLIAALALCFATSSSLDATALDGAALAAASADAGAAPAAAGPAVQPPFQTLPQENPVFVSYGSNDTYANLDTIDRSLVTYGDQPSVAPPVPPSNYVLVGSSIPAKM